MLKKTRPVFNPFYRAVKADDLSFEQIKKLFVPEASPIWEEVQQPVNQVIRGPRGAGKTILLKHLSYLGGGTGHGHIGVYIQISRIANTFRHLFPGPEQEQRAALESDYQRVFADYLVLEIIKEIARALAHMRERNGQSENCPGIHVEALLDGLTSITTLPEIVKFCVFQQRDIEKRFRAWELDRSCTWQPLFDPVASLNRITGATVSALEDNATSDTNLYLLLDESAPIPIRCQKVVNSLLQRGRSFTTKLAVRPYEWQTLDTYNGLQLESGTDFRRLELIYPDEMTDEYVDTAKRILNRLLEIKIVEPEIPPNGWPRLSSLGIEQIFPSSGTRVGRTYSGFRDICALSSSNPQNLLSICSLLLSLASEEGELPETGIPEVHKLLQHQAMVAWSKDQEQTIPDAGVLSFSRAVLRMLAKNSEIGVGISLNVKDDSASLFPSDYLPEDAATVLKPGFALGFLRLVGSQPLPWDEVPASFAVSRSLLPSYDIPLRAGRTPELKLDISFVRSHLREQGGGKHPANVSHADRKLTAFLSTSFSESLTAERAIIRDTLKQVGIECQPLEGDQFLFSTIYKQISRRELTILNASEPRPYTLLELGICAGLRKSKPVICVFNDDNDVDSFAKLPEFLKLLGIINFSCEPNRLTEMAARVRRNAELLLGSPSEFEKVALTGVSLRPKRAKKTVYISYPDLPIWKLLIPSLREALESKGFSLITENDATVYQANSLQIPIFCASLANHVVVDTSGQQQPDLLQAYKLGVAVARGRPTLRVEQKGSNHRDVFSALPIDYAEWREKDELIGLVLGYLIRQKD